MRVDESALQDLARFARIEVHTHDVEPWADLIRSMRDAGDLSPAESDWLATLYNTFDDLHSAWTVMRRWPHISLWAADPAKADITALNCTQERRNLRGGRVVKRFDSYADAIGIGSERAWMTRAVRADRSPGENFAALTTHMRSIWGVGRQSAFEWAEFAGKVADLPVDAADGQLWESSGPRRCLERIFGLCDPNPATLEHVADLTRAFIADRTGILLPWVDFETIICDFNVMRDGRYYPGAHLSALREEILTLPDPMDQVLLRAAWRRVVPAPWADIAPGISKAKRAVYAQTGRMITSP